MSITELETRLARLEKKVQQITHTDGVSAIEAVNGWIDQIHGTFQNDPAYRQAARLGRQWRKGQRGKGAAASPRARAK